VALNDHGGLLMGTVDFAGTQREVCLAYLAGDIAVGDYALVHVGFALARIDEAAARETLRTLAEIGVLAEETAAPRDGLAGREAAPP
jgi:hydrogenase expression/formation protein HypC